MASGRPSPAQNAAALAACKFGTGFFVRLSTQGQSGRDVVTAALDAETDPVEIDKVAGQFVLDYVIQLLKEGASEQAPPVGAAALQGRIDALQGTGTAAGTFERYWTTLAPPPVSGPAVPTITKDLNKLLDIGASGNQYRYALTGPSNTDQCVAALKSSQGLSVEDSCYICGTPLPLAPTCNAPAECEHILPVFYAAMYLFLYTGPNRGTTEYRRGMDDLLADGAGELEYRWAHMCCNRLKSNISPVYLSGASGFAANEQGWKVILNRIRTRLSANLSSLPCPPSSPKVDVSGSCAALKAVDATNPALSQIAVDRGQTIMGARFIANRRTELTNMLSSPGGMIPTLNKLLTDIGGGAKFYAFTKIFLFSSMHGLKGVLFAPEDEDATEAGRRAAKQALSNKRRRETNEFEAKKKQKMAEYGSAALRSGLRATLISCASLAEEKAGLFLERYLDEGSQRVPREAQVGRIQFAKVSKLFGSANLERLFSTAPDRTSVFGRRKAEMRRKFNEIGVALKACVGAVDDIIAWRDSADEDVPITSEDLSTLLDWRQATELLDKPKALLETYQRLRATILPTASAFRSRMERRVGVSGGGVAADPTVVPTLQTLGKFSSFGRPSLKKGGPVFKPLTSVAPTQAPRAPSPADELLSMITEKESQVLNSQPSPEFPRESDPMQEEVRMKLASALSEAASEYEATLGYDDAVMDEAYAIEGSDGVVEEALSDPSDRAAMELVLQSPYASCLLTLLQAQAVCAAKVARGMQAYDTLTWLMSQKVDRMLGAESQSLGEKKETAVATLVSLALSYNTVLTDQSDDRAGRVDSEAPYDELLAIQHLILEYNRMPSIGPFPQLWASSPMHVTSEEGRNASSVGGGGCSDSTHRSGLSRGRRTRSRRGVMHTSRRRRRAKARGRA